MRLPRVISLLPFFILLLMPGILWSQSEQHFLTIGSNLFGINDDHGHFTQLEAKADLSTIPGVKALELAGKGGGWLLRWHYIVGGFNGSLFWDDFRFIYDGNAATSLRMKFLPYWPLIIDLSCGWQGESYFTSSDNQDDVSVVNNLDIQFKLLYDLVNTKYVLENQSPVWHRFTLTGNGAVDLPFQENKTSFTAFAGIRYSIESSDIDIPEDYAAHDPWLDLAAGFGYERSLLNAYTPTGSISWHLILGQKLFSFFDSIGIRLDFPGLGLQFEHEVFPDLSLKNWAIVVCRPVSFPM